MATPERLLNCKHGRVIVIPFIFLDSKKGTIVYDVPVLLNAMLAIKSGDIPLWLEVLNVNKLGDADPILPPKANAVVASAPVGVFCNVVLAFVIVERYKLFAVSSTLC